MASTAGNQLKQVAFEILGFWDGGNDGMIESLREGTDLAEGFFGIHGRFVDDVDEHFAADVVGATEGGEDAIVLEQFEGAKMDLLVPAQGVLHATLGLCKRRWIEDDEIVGGAGGFAIFEKIKHVGFDGLNGEVIGGGIAAHQFDGLAADIHGRDFFGSAFGASEGEGALIGETVQHRASFCVLGDFSVIRDLVQIESCFLSMEEIHGEGHAITMDGLRTGIRAEQHTGH